MYFTDDSLFPENMQPTIITAAPFGPEWLPGDVEDLPVSFEEQVQAAVDCYNAGATMLHVHVRDPKTGQGSSNFDQYNEFLGMSAQGGAEDDPAGRRLDLVRAAHRRRQGQVARLRHAPHADRAGPEARLRHHHDRHDAVGHHAGLPPGDAKGTHLADPKVAAAWAGMVVDSTPAFYVEHLKRLSKNKIQPYFVPGHVHQLEIIERLLRAGIYKGPLNLALCGYGGGSMGRNPFDWMEMLRRTPHGASSVTFWSSMRGNIAIQTLATILGVNVRVGNEDNIWDMHKKRWPTVKQVEWAVKQSEQFGRKVATADEARKIMKIGVWYDTSRRRCSTSACRRTAPKATRASWPTRPTGGCPRPRRRSESDQHPVKSLSLGITSDESPAPTETVPQCGGSGATKKSPLTPL